MTVQDNPSICYDECLLSNCYMSDNTDTVHVRWCDSCQHWLHEYCAGQAMERSTIAPSSQQSYLTVDTMDVQRKEAMPSDIQVILGWPICRGSKQFSVNGEEYWHPHSMEILVEMARKWYWEGEVPDNWRLELTSTHAGDESMEDELRDFLVSPYPLYYYCPTCTSYI
jgi:hypothetical protein